MLSFSSDVFAEVSSTFLKFFSAFKLLINCAIPISERDVPLIRAEFSEIEIDVRITSGGIFDETVSILVVGGAAADTALIMLNLF